MAAKIALVFLAAFVVFQLFSVHTDATVIRRDAPQTTEKNDLEEAFNSMKKGLEDFVSQVQSSDLFKNVTKIVDEFGQKVKNKGSELIQDIKTETSGKN